MLERDCERAQASWARPAAPGGGGAHGEVAAEAGQGVERRRHQPKRQHCRRRAPTGEEGGREIESVAAGGAGAYARGRRRTRLSRRSAPPTCSGRRVPSSLASAAGLLSPRAPGWPPAAAAPVGELEPGQSVSSTGTECAACCAGGRARPTPRSRRPSPRSRRRSWSRRGWGRGPQRRIFFTRVSPVLPSFSAPV